MTNQKDTAGKVMTAFYRSCLGKKPTFKDDKVAVAAALLEVVNQYSNSLPPDPNMDQFYARLYGDEEVVYVNDILELINELEKQ